MALQGVANFVMRGLLSTPGIANGIGKRLITLHVVGRKSGKRYTIPVAYTQHEGTILIGTPFAWGKNLRTGESLTVKYKGHQRTADVVCRDNHAFANFNKIGLDKDGNPNAEDLRAAWQSGARAFKLTLR
jgi:hypothetical protein